MGLECAEHGQYAMAMLEYLASVPKRARCLVSSKLTLWARTSLASRVLINPDVFLVLGNNNASSLKVSCFPKFVLNPLSASFRYLPPFSSHS